ncbi:MAG TPA: ABC transporter permease [Patescibacteria group bacterium]|nr:ABC transporter permease [Patescibacteria group bacterium]
MPKGYIKLAVKTLRSNRMRSFLTMLGIVIGVASVVVTVSIGEGVKQQVVHQINNLGPDLITVRGGKVLTRDQSGKISKVNLLNVYGNSSLSENDYSVVKSSQGIGMAVPFASINGIPRTDTKEMNNALLVATTSEAPEILNQKVEFGSFFGVGDGEKDVAVIGRRVAEELFQESVPIGRSFSVRGRTFVVYGLFEEFEANPLSPNSDYNSAIFIPYQTGKKISAGSMQIYQILVRPKDPKLTKETIKSLDTNLTSAHAGQADFTILKQDENLAIANTVLNLLTAFIGGIAAISLLVGGIGIMNIMLVSVTERTREIGLRKAVGSTNHQILTQFLVEAMLLSFSGGIFGIFVSLLANIFIRIFTPLQPVITFPIMGIALVVALAVGTFFGVTPAIKAAHKDPIESLRHD